MAQKGSGRKRLALSSSATEDLASIHSYTTHQWGWEQAESYYDFLLAEIEVLLTDASHSHPIEHLSPARATFVRWPKARHGHYIVFRSTD